MAFFPIPFGHVEVRVDTRPQLPPRPPREAPAMRTETFQTPGETRLDIRLGAGEVRVETAEVQETTVVLEPLRDNDASTAAVENARVELRDRGNGHEVVIDVRDRGRGIFRNAEVLVAVTSPEGTSVETKSGSADIEGRGRFGSVEVETGSGDVEFGEIAGDANVNAASGDVQTRLGRRRRADQHRLRRRADPLDRRRGQDQLRLGRRDHPRGPGASCRSTPPPATCSCARPARRSASTPPPATRRSAAVTTGKVTLKSASGDLKVGIREGTSLWVDARSRSGEVRSELPVSELPPDGNGPTRRAAREHDERRHHGRPGMNPTDPTTGAVVAPAPRRLFRLPEALQAARFPPLLGGRDGVALRRPGDADRAAAGRRARAARERRPDGLPRRGAALPEPALLAARRRLDRSPRPAARDDDLHRARPRGRAGDDPGRLRVRRADADPALRRELPDRDAERALLRLLQHALRLARAARALPRGELAAERQPRVLVRRRAEPRRGCSCRCSRRRSRSSSTRSRSSSRR